MSEREGEMSSQHPPPQERQPKLKFYHGSGCLSSEKVLMALYEKNLPFELCRIDVLGGEHYDPSFLEMSPKAIIPVLVDDETIIVDASNILQYLEKTYSFGDYPKLMPSATSEMENKLYKDYSNLLEETSIEILTFGALYHSTYLINPKISEVEKFRRLDAHEVCSARVAKLETDAEESENAENAEDTDFIVMQHRKSLKFITGGQNMRELCRALDDMKKSVQSVNHMLEDKGSFDHWLCGPQFSIVDIDLTVILHRLEHVGLYSHFFSSSQSLVAKYYERVKLRSSFAKTFTYKEFSDKLNFNRIVTYVIIILIAFLFFAVLGVLSYLRAH